MASIPCGTQLEGAIMAGGGVEIGKTIVLRLWEGDKMIVVDLVKLV